MGDSANGSEMVEALPVGTRVEVRDRFDGTWAKGFTIAEATDRGYRLQRRSDRQVLPGEFATADIRRERRSMWWV